MFGKLCFHKAFFNPHCLKERLTWRNTSWAMSSVSYEEIPMGIDQ